MPPLALLGAIRRPVAALRQDTVGDRVQNARFSLGFFDFVGLLAVAAPVRELQVVYVAWMPAFCDGYDVVYAR